MTEVRSTNRPTPRLVATALVALTAVLLAGCGALRDDKGRPLTTLNPKGPQAEKIDNLVKPVFIVAGIVFVLVEVGVVFLVIRFRRRKDDVDGVDEPVQTHGIPRLEWTWTILPAVLLGILAIFNVRTIWELEDRDPDALKVQVYGQQWWWEFRYDTNDDGTPDIITANQMVVPAGRQVDLTIRSNDVIHSFWIPALNGKKDAVPGRSHDWTLEAAKPGLYQGTCTEFCGLSHAYMRMEVKAVTTAEFAQWEKDQQMAPTLPTDPTPDVTTDDPLVLTGFKTFMTQCATCHQINGIDPDGKKADGALYAKSKYDGPDPTYRGGIDPKTGYPRHPLTSGNAPNLTHLMSRNRFAGNLFPLYDANGAVNESDLGNWLRNPSKMKPMAPDANRGMPTLGLTQTQIDALVAFLATLK